MRTRLILALVAVLLVLSGAGFFWYTTTTYYAVQQVGTAILRHDQAAFEKHLDAENLVTSLTDELLFQPAAQTPGLNEMQRYVAGGALLLMKSRIDGALLRSVKNLASSERLVSFHPVTFYANAEVSSNAGVPFLSNANTNTGVSSYRTNLVQCAHLTEEPAIKIAFDLRGFTRDLGKELRTEQDGVKRRVAQRMHEYAASHQETLVGNLIAGRQSLKSMVQEWGLQKENFRTMYFHNKDDRELCTVEFFSPKVNQNVPISLQLVPISASDPFSQWKILKLYEPKETLRKLGEDTDKQVQELVAYSMQDVTSREAWQRTGNVLKRLGESDATKELLQNIHDKFR